MNLEKLSKPELLTLFSILEGELEARDLVIEALKVILDLEEERQRHAQDTAEGDDVTYMLEKERERLTQQLEFEKSQVKKFEKEQKKLSSQLEEERSRHKQLSSMLVLECKKATSKAAEEGQKAGELSLKLEKEKSRASKLEEELAAERKRGLQTEAQVEKQLSEFDIEREQLRAKLNREENRTRALKEEMESLKKLVKDLEAAQQHSNSSEQGREPVTTSRGTATEPPMRVSVFCQTESIQTERSHSSIMTKLTDTGLPGPSSAPYPYAKANGHCDPETQTTRELTSDSSTENQGPPREKSAVPAQEKPMENAVGAQRGSRIPWRYSNGERPDVSAELGPLKEQQAFLAAEPSRQPLKWTLVLMPLLSTNAKQASSGWQPHPAPKS